MQKKLNYDYACPGGMRFHLPEQGNPAAIKFRDIHHPTDKSYAMMRLSKKIGLAKYNNIKSEIR